MTEEPRVDQEQSTKSGELTNRALTQELLATIEAGSFLIEEPLDSGLWPTVQLSEGAIQALVEAVHEIQRDEEAA